MHSCRLAPARGSWRSRIHWPEFARRGRRIADGASGLERPLPLYLLSPSSLGCSLARLAISLLQAAPFWSWLLGPGLLLGCAWALLTAPGGCWPLLAAPGRPSAFLAVPGLPSLPLAAPGRSWLPFSAPLLLAAPGWSCLLCPTPSGPRLLLAAPGCSWLLLGAPGQLAAPSCPLGPGCSVQGCSWAAPGRS